MSSARSVSLRGIFFDSRGSAGAANRAGKTADPAPAWRCGAGFPPARRALAGGAPLSRGRRSGPGPGLAPVGHAFRPGHCCALVSARPAAPWEAPPSLTARRLQARPGARKRTRPRPRSAHCCTKLYAPLSAQIAGWYVHRDLCK